MCVCDTGNCLTELQRGLDLGFRFRVSKGTCLIELHFGPTGLSISRPVSLNR